MTLRLCLLALAGCVAVPLAAQESGTGPLPSLLQDMQGCWSGEGKVMDKAVTISMRISPIALGALLAVDADSRAKADPADRYAAHLIFGAAATDKGEAQGKLTGFWGDSFGGGYTATGQGGMRADGFDMAYAYPDATFLNSWRLGGDALRWSIVTRGPSGTEQPFAEYTLRRQACDPKSPA
ncbi:hypothetical protein [Rhizorhabdus phycosphaerae]|uniref:hypothetical protein n=1 Tax=Rhizorhabdus phycosphaerae TaxID=2711156 RepID=UPI0013EBB28E|nr:hypothetical protein [Rhizorhabdus phycosphaerae]